MCPELRDLCAFLKGPPINWFISVCSRSEGTFYNTHPQYKFFDQFANKCVFLQFILNLTGFHFDSLAFILFVVRYLMSLDGLGRVGLGWAGLGWVGPLH